MRDPAGMRWRKKKKKKNSAEAEMKLTSRRLRTLPT